MRGHHHSNLCVLVQKLVVHDTMCFPCVCIGVINGIGSARVTIAWLTNRAGVQNCAWSQHQLFSGANGNRVYTACDQVKLK